MSRNPLILAALLGLWPLAAQAETPPLPALYAVSGVESTDHLNLRAAPSAKAEIRATLPPTARDLEVTGWNEAQTWAQVNWGEGSGWVSARYLRPQPTVWAAGALPKDLTCYGTEPFWQITKQTDQLTLTHMDQPPQTLPLSAVQDRGLPQDALRVIHAEGKTLVLQPQSCSDGMSDRSFGLSLLVIQKDQPLLAGCCSIAPR